MTLIEYFELNRFNSKNPISKINPELIPNLEERRKREGIEPDGFFVWCDMIWRTYEGARIDPPCAGETTEERHRRANGEAPAPAPRIPVKPAPVHPGNGRTADEVRKKIEDELAAKERAAIEAWNRRVPHHLRKHLPDEDAE